MATKKLYLRWQLVENTEQMGQSCANPIGNNILTNFAGIYNKHIRH